MTKKIDMKLIKDFICTESSIELLSKKYNFSVADVLYQVERYSRKTTSQKLALYTRKKYKLTIVNRFLGYHKSTIDFVSEYGFTYTKFFKLIVEIVEDTKLIPDDNKADKIYVKATRDTNISTARIPKRIICNMAKMYLSPDFNSFESVGQHYGVDRDTVSAAIKIGIWKSYLNYDTSRQVSDKNIAQFRPRPPKYIVDSYDKVFEKRYCYSKLCELKAIMEDEPHNESVDYEKLSERIETLEQQIKWLS